MLKTRIPSATLNNVTGEVVDAALKVHTQLGPGLLESAYEACLAYELAQRGFAVQRQVPMPVFYGDVEIDAGYRLDLLVNECVIVELKAVDALAPIHTAQMLTYLRLSGYQVGLIINFNVGVIKDGIKRVRI